MNFNEVKGLMRQRWHAVPDWTDRQWLRYLDKKVPRIKAEARYRTAVINYMEPDKVPLDKIWHYILWQFDFDVVEISHIVEGVSDVRQ